MIDHNFESKGVPPQTWFEILKDWPFYLFSGILIAGLCTCLIDIDKKKIIIVNKNHVSLYLCPMKLPLTYVQNLSVALFPDFIFAIPIHGFA